MRHLKTLFILSASGLLALMLLVSNAHAKTATTALHDLLSKPQQYVGQTVNVTGHYQGWRGSCKNSGQNKRSDWLITDAGDCIYVSGQKPSSLSPATPSDQNLLISGNLATNSKGKVYFKATQVTVLPPDKCDCR